MRHSIETRMEAVRYFEAGYGGNATAMLLGLHKNTVRKWHYTYRALGKEALLVAERRSYTQETKVKAAKAILEKGLPKAIVMERFCIRSRTAVENWCKLYQQGGPDALLPKPKGRPKKSEQTFSTREEELEARVQELELENEILKRINALADENERE